MVIDNRRNIINKYLRVITIITYTTEILHYKKNFNVIFIKFYFTKSENIKI